MSRPRKGAHLYLRRERREADGRLRQRPQWVCRDGNRERGTGFGPEDCRDASDPRLQQALADFIAEIHVPPRGRRHPSEILIADVIALYLRDKARHHARPDETGARAVKLLTTEFTLGTRRLSFGAMTLDGLDGQTARAYAAARSTRAAARRELEDLRAAIRHHWREGFASEERKVVLPDRPPRRERWLTRAEAARHIWAAWRYREQQNYRGTDRATRRHIAQFDLVALYTGSRAGAICTAALSPMPGRGFLDLESGLFYRRAPGESETKKRKPPIRIPAPLLAHIRRWKRANPTQRFVVEFNRKPVQRLGKAFMAVTRAAGLATVGPDKVTPHVFRHTHLTWQMQAGTDPWEAGGYAGLSPETVVRVYGHHHPDHLEKARSAFQRLKRSKPERPLNATGNSGTDSERVGPNVTDDGGNPPNARRA